MLASAPAFAQPDLTVTKTHLGNFAQGQAGAQYTIAVKNIGSTPVLAGDTVTLVDTLPTGLTATAMSGNGWTCDVATITCTNTNSIGPGASFFNITLTVSVAANAGSPLINSVTVSGGGETNTANDTATDSTIILGPPDLTVTKTHVGNFAQGQVGADYTITVSNAPGVGAVTAGNTVTVVDTLPPGLTATAMSGLGWICAVATVTCTNDFALASGASHFDITLTVSVAGSAGSPLINSVTVSGGGDVSSANNTATDSTTILGPPDLTVTKTHAGNFVRGQTGAQYTITVNNVGASAVRPADTVTVVDMLPPGLTATGMSGFGWTCVVATVTCTKNSALAPGSSYPPITLTVSVAGNAGSPLINSVTVSGGGDVNAANNTATDSTTIAISPPVLQSAVSRKAHGAAGTFDLPLVIDVTNPATEPRRGPAHSIVLTFDKAITGAAAAITEGAGAAGSPTFSGNNVIVALTGVTDQQYVTIALTNVASSDGGAGGSGTVRIGFLVGDVNQNRAVTVADLGMVNAQLAQVVTAANYLKDVNASGTLTVADKGITNANLARSLPAP